MRKFPKKVEIVILDDDKEGQMETWIGRLARELGIDEKEEIIHKRESPDFTGLPSYRVNADIVLLDIGDMEPPAPIVIKAIRNKWPRLPIVILSKYKDLSDALELFNIGADDYIIKGDVQVNDPVVLGVTYKAVGWDRAVELITRLINDYQPLKRSLYEGNTIGRLIKKSADNEKAKAKLSNEFRFLKMIEGDMKNSSARKLFPVETLSPAGEHAYEIPFYRAKSLRETLFELRDEEEIFKIATTVIGKTLSELGTALFNVQTFPVGNKEIWFHKAYIKKFNDRAEETYCLLKECNEVDRVALRLMLEAKQFIIDEEKLLAPITLLSVIGSDPAFRDRVVPPTIGYIHGDLHFGNILVDAAIPERTFIKLIDPAGFLDGGDFAYDVGKLLLSSEAKHDMIDDGYLGTPELIRSIRQIGETISVATPRREYETAKALNQGRSGDSVISYFQQITEAHFRAYDRIAQWIFEELLTERFKDYPNLLIRSRLYAAMHSCTVGKFHVERDPTGTGPIKAIAFYVTGVQMMNRVARDLGVDIEAHWDALGLAK